VSRACSDRWFIHITGSLSESYWRTRYSAAKKTVFVTFLIHCVLDVCGSGIKHPCAVLPSVESAFILCSNVGTELMFRAPRRDIRCP
jgi:hypothetical protein